MQSVIPAPVEVFPVLVKAPAAPHRVLVPRHALPVTALVTFLMIFPVTPPGADRAAEIPSEGEQEQE